MKQTILILTLTFLINNLVNAQSCVIAKVLLDIKRFWGAQSLMENIFYRVVTIILLLCGMNTVKLLTQ
jgi:hypothetical protein